jgi:hypothetical protein
MIERFLNKLLTRWLAGLIVGLPFTWLSLILGVHGIILGKGGIKEGGFDLIAPGIITIAGFIGIVGAWIRVIRPTYAMSESILHATRIMLYCGIAASVALFIVVIIGSGFISSLPFALVIALGILFIIATPKQPSIRKTQ